MNQLAFPLLHRHNTPDGGGWRRYFFRGARFQPSRVPAAGLALMLLLAPSPVHGADVSLGRLRVDFSGQISRALMLADDGIDRRIAHVDNDGSSTRARAVPTLRVNGDVTLTGRVEYEFQENPSDGIVIDSASVNDPAVGNGRHNVIDTKFRDRHVEIAIDSKTWGRLTIGRGDTASDYATETDLSGLSVSGLQSRPNRMIGALRFRGRDGAGDVAYGRTIDNVDGLGRENRVRYDTPRFLGLQLSTSRDFNDRRDVALRWGGPVPGDIKMAAAFFASDNGGLGDAIKDQLGGSVSFLHRSGWSLTGAAARRVFEAEHRADALYGYAKLGYQVDLTALGRTYVGADAGRGEAFFGDRTSDFAGLGVVQALARHDLDLHAAWRRHWLDGDPGGGPGERFHAIDIVLVGARWRF